MTFPSANKVTSFSDIIKYTHNKKGMKRNVSEVSDNLPKNDLP